VFPNFNTDRAKGALNMYVYSIKRLLLCAFFLRGSYIWLQLHRIQILLNKIDTKLIYKLYIIICIQHSNLNLPTF